MALGRIAESEDDELAYAFHAGNGWGEAYDRRRASRAYMRRAYAIYRRHHIERAVAMVLKAVGLTPNGWLARASAGLAWRFVQYRQNRLVRAAA